MQIKTYEERCVAELIRLLGADMNEYHLDESEISRPSVERILNFIKQEAELALAARKERELAYEDKLMRRAGFINPDLWAQHLKDQQKQMDIEIEERKQKEERKRQNRILAVEKRKATLATKKAQQAK